MSHRSNPAVKAAAVTTSDTVDLPNGVTRALYIGVTGNVVAVMEGTAITFTAVPVGVLPIECTRVNATGTTASAIVALY
ncbi:MAG TPA: hypothetical protein VIV09_05820 [Pseudolabrys sp.]